MPTTKTTELEDYKTALRVVNMLLANGKIQPDRRFVQTVDLLASRIKELSCQTNQ